MFASQLLRILQALPRNEINETCSTFFTDDPDEVMKRNRDGISYDLTGNSREIDPLTSTDDKDGKRSASVSLLVEETRGLKENRSALFDNVLNADVLACDHTDKDNLTNSPKQEFSGFEVDFRKVDEKGSISVPPSKCTHNDILCCANGFGPCVIDSKDIFELCNCPGLQQSLAANDFAICCENEVRHPRSACCISSALMNKVMHCLVDKNAVESELPELMICWKQIIYNIIKGKCTDEKVLLKDKYFLESTVDGQNDFSTPLSYDESKNFDTVKEKISTGFDKNTSTEYMNKGKTGNDSSLEFFREDVFEDCISRMTMQMPKANDSVVDWTLEGTSRKDTVPNSMLYVQDNYVLASSNHDGCEVEQRSCQISYAEGTSIITALEESIKIDTVDILHYNSKVDRESITFDFNPSKNEVSNQYKNQKNVSKNPHASSDMPGHDDGISDNYNDAQKVFHGERDVNLSEAVPVPGLMPCTVPVVYSGNISLRSDSSRSSKSFAFPILQSEWNNSPERMAKEDHRHSQKYRFWKWHLICCRF